MKRSAIIISFFVLMASSCLCPTRFYFLSSGTTPEVVPSTANLLGWDNVSAMKTFGCTSQRRGTPLTYFEFPASAGNKKNIINCRYISQPLIAQTISGSVEGQAKGYASTIAKVVYSSVGIYVINKYGTSEGILLALLADGSAQTTFSTVELTNRNLPPKTALTPQTCSDGARLVIEIGSITGAAGAGTSSQEVGDSASNDLPRDNTTVGNYNPWIEFSNLILTKSQVTLIE